METRRYYLEQIIKDFNSNKIDHKKAVVSLLNYHNFPSGQLDDLRKKMRNNILTDKENLLVTDICWLMDAFCDKT